MVRPTLIDLNPVELKYYPFMISLNKHTGSCNVLSPKMCVSKETKDINVTTFNTITNKNQAKAMADCKCKFNSTICNSNQKWNNKTSQCEWKNYRTCEKDNSWNLSTCICENSKHLKSTSVTEYDEVITVIDIISTKKAIATNVTSTASINCHSKKVKDCCILHTVL